MKALVLAGGGSKGAFQAGVLDQLKLQRYDFVVGTSTGAMNAVGYAYLGSEGLADIWRGIKSRSDVFSFSWSTEGVFSPEPLRRKLLDVIEGQSRIPAWVSSVCLEDCSLAYSCSGDPDFAHMAVASCSIPGAVVPTIWGGRTYVDGGVRENAPVSKAKQLGATEIDVILCNPLQWDSTWDGDHNMASYLVRSFDIMCHEAMINDLAPGCRVWAPNMDLGGCLDFSQCPHSFELGKVAQFKVI